MPGVSLGEEHLVDAFWTAKGWRARSRVIQTAASQRIDHDCDFYGACGGCTHRHLSEADRRNWLLGRLDAVMTKWGYHGQPVRWFGGARE